MKCLNCNEFFIIKKDINSLFKEEKYFLCNDCYKKNPIKITLNILPVSNKLVKIFTLFENYKYVNKDAFIIEYSFLINYVYSLDNNIFFLLLDNVSVNEKLQESLDIISELFDKNIVIVGFF